MRYQVVLASSPLNFPLFEINVILKLSPSFTIGSDWCLLVKKDFNFFISLDGKARLDEDAVEGETYFLVDNGKDQWQWWCFELKYPEKEDFCSDAQFRSFFNQLEEYIKYFRSAIRGGK